MSDCCGQNAPPNGCNQGRDCPCNEPTTEELLDKLVHRAATVGMVLLSLVVIVGIYLWATH